MHHANPVSRDIPRIIDIKFCNNEKNESIVGIDCYAESEEVCKTLLPKLGSVDDFSDANPEDRSLLQTLNDSSPKDRVFPASEIKIQQCKDASGKSYVKSSIYYVLSKRTHGLLNWIGCFLRYLDKNKNIVQSIHIKDAYKSMSDFLVGEKDILSIEEYATENNYFNKENWGLCTEDDKLQLSCDLTSKIRSLFGRLDCYIDPLYALQTIINCSLESMTLNGEYRFFYQLIEYRNRFKILCTKVWGRSNHTIVQEICDYLLDPNLTKESRTLLLKKYIRLWVDQDEQWFIPHMLSGINDRLKMNLLDQAIGDQSYNSGFVFVYPEGVFTKTHTQWFLIRDTADTDLIIDSEGHLVMTNLSNNQTYKNTFAPGNRLHDQFADNMREFAEKCGFSLVNNIDFHKGEIKFSIESSKELIELGYGMFSYNQLKKEYHRNNLSLFFKHYKESELNNNKSTGETNILDLPDDVLRYIVNFV